MKRITRIAPALFFVVILITCSDEPGTTTKTTPAAGQPYVVMLSLDGFRWDYASKVPTPNLDYIASHGVKAQVMIPS